MNIAKKQLDSCHQEADSVKPIKLGRRKDYSKRDYFHGLVKIFLVFGYVFVVCLLKKDTKTHFPADSGFLTF